MFFGTQVDHAGTSGKCFFERDLNLGFEVIAIYSAVRAPAARPPPLPRAAKLPAKKVAQQHAGGTGDGDGRVHDLDDVIGVSAAARARL